MNQTELFSYINKYQINVALLQSSWVACLLFQSVAHLGPNGQTFLPCGVLAVWAYVPLLEALVTRQYYLKQMGCFQAQFLCLFHT